MSPGLLGRGAQRISEEVLLATDRAQTNGRRETQMRLVFVMIHIEVMRIKEEVNLVTRTGGKFWSLYRGVTALNRGIHVMQRQWLQR